MARRRSGWGPVAAVRQSVCRRRRSGPSSRRLPLALISASLALATATALLHRPLGSRITATASDSGPDRDRRLGRIQPLAQILQADPLAFTPSELQELQRRFGVHGPQPKLAQLFTEGLDQLQPLRAYTLSRLEELRPVILSESRRHRINPMLVTAVLFDELQHAKPGEDSALVAESGLFQTHGPAQLGLGELQKQGLLPADPTPEQISSARRLLLDPEHNVQVLVGKFARLSRSLGFSRRRALMASLSSRDAKALATLAYLHNGKLDYPGRILRYMQSPELHGLLYGTRRTSTSPLI